MKTQTIKQAQADSIKPLEPTPTQQFATMLECQHGNFYITDHNGNRIAAYLAPSCVLKPEDNDVVNIVNYDDRYFITAVLIRASILPKSYCLKGEVYAGLEESHINIQPHQIQMQSTAISLKSKVLNGIARMIEWGATVFQVKSQRIEHQSKQQHIACEALLQIDTKNRVTKVASLDSHQAETLIQKNQQMNITTQKLNVNG